MSYRFLSKRWNVKVHPTKLARKCIQHRPNTRYQSTVSTQQRQYSENAERCMNLESTYGAHNYHPIPVVISKGKGIHVWDVDGKEYIDCLSAYSAVNQGHSHPKIVNTLVEQANKLALTSRAFYNDVLGEYCEFVTNYFGYKRVLPMNSGVEACESAVKIARRWGYEVKGIPSNQAQVLFVNGNFWGRSIGAVSGSSDPESYTNYGPFVPKFDKIDYNNISQLESYFEKNHLTTCAFMMEPIQGEAGVIIPDDGYLLKISNLCKKYNILWIADEVQTGLGRCGTQLCIDHEIDINDRLNNGPDLITMGKALSGGVYPVSAVLSKTNEIMDVLTPGTHGSTYGGNPLACKIAMTALSVLNDENMIENSNKIGKILLNELKKLKNEFNIVKTVRGRGLFCAIEIIQDDNKGVNAWNVCLEMANRGVVAKPTHDDIIRLSPPLIINEKQILQVVDVLRDSLKALEN